MSWTREQVLDLYTEYVEGKTLAELAHQCEISAERVSQLFAYHSLPRFTSTQRARHKRLEDERKAREQASYIQELYKTYGTIEAVVERIELPREVVTPIIDGIPNREAFRRRGRHPKTSLEVLAGDLIFAAQIAGEPLTITRYREVAKDHGLASASTHLKAFGSWADALGYVGVKGNDARGHRPNSITLEECLRAVYRCHQETGEWPSYERYVAWARDRDVPSGSTVRLKAGSWAKVVQQALDEAL